MNEREFYTKDKEFNRRFEEIYEKKEDFTFRGRGQRFYIPFENCLVTITQPDSPKRGDVFPGYISVGIMILGESENIAKNIIEFKRKIESSTGKSLKNLVE